MTVCDTEGPSLPLEAPALLLPPCRLPGPRGCSAPSLNLDLRSLWFSLCICAPSRGGILQGGGFLLTTPRFISGPSECKPLHPPWSLSLLDM